MRSKSCSVFPPFRHEIKFEMRENEFEEKNNRQTKHEKSILWRCDLLPRSKSGTNSSGWLCFISSNMLLAMLKELNFQRNFNFLLYRQWGFVPPLNSLLVFRNESSRYFRTENGLSLTLLCVVRFELQDKWCFLSTSSWNCILCQPTMSLNWHIVKLVFFFLVPFHSTLSSSSLYE